MIHREKTFYIIKVRFLFFVVFQLRIVVLAVSIFKLYVIFLKTVKFSLALLNITKTIH